LGDALHNLHSALDNLIPEVIRATGRVPSRRATFPIYDNARSFDAHIRNRLKAMRSDHVALLESLQPYPGRNQPINDLLGTLSLHSNLDKHTAIHPTFAAVLPHVEDYEIRAEGPLPADVPFEIEWLAYGIPLEDSTPVMRIRIGASVSYPPKLDFDLPIAIAFGERGLLAVGLPHVRDAVESVIDRFLSTLS
jgi:hypothetical protein